jgi:hypothetical protein
MNFIIAVGGTGQIILHHLNSLYLSGVLAEPFVGRVIDTDEMISSLAYSKLLYEKSSKVFSDLIQLGHPMPQPPEISLMHTGPFSAGTISEQLTGRPISITPGYENALNAYFSRSELAQATQEGLFARPALSSVLVASKVLNQLTSASFARAAKVFVVGSMIGGTGGGLIVPILSRLRQICAANTRLYAILLGDYFNPDEGRVTDAATRFPSNWLLTTAMLEKSVPSIWKYAHIAEPKLAKKEELPASEAPFPPEDSPFWRAVVNYKYLTEDTTTVQGGSFADNELTWNVARGALKYTEAITAIDLARSNLTVLSRRKVFGCYASEPFPHAVWGKFATFVSAIIKLHLKAMGPDANVARFLARLQRELGHGMCLIPESPSLRVMGLLPGRHIGDTTLHQFLSMQWPRLAPESKGQVFKNFDEAAVAVACAASFLAARIGSLGDR